MTKQIATASRPAPRANRPNWKSIAALGYALIISTFGIVGGWAAVTKIDRAVQASGTVSIETNHKTVQHFEGGIVRAILVKEGDFVAAGATLFRLENVQAKASFDSALNQLLSSLASEARLIAERDQMITIVWPREIEERMISDPFVAHVVIDQQGDFAKRRGSLQGQVKVLESRIDQLSIQIDGVRVQKESTEKQIAFIEKELAGLRILSDKNLVPVTRLYAMERERERLEGVIGQATTDSAKDQGQIEEMRSQIQQLKEKFQEEVAASLVDTRQKLSDLREKVAVAEDILRRVEVLAPVSGTVQNMKVFTIGQVIRPGESLLDIVPEKERLIVEAQFSPTDIDGVHAGQEAEIRFPAFHSRLIPLLLGRLESISQDRLTDDTSKQPYYRGIVALDMADIPADLRARVRAGMPAEIVIAYGERTVLSYLISPLASTLRKTFID
jgi:HlyD family secretion protein